MQGQHELWDDMDPRQDGRALPGLGEAPAGGQAGPACALASFNRPVNTMCHDVKALLLAAQGRYASSREEWGRGGGRGGGRGAAASGIV
ncbi:hypothetical protein WJX81_008500 [Elliptochloris bilobata]|uniref:Uncharacterized protein n=1 Tax=Elliptochloris bilobata TaxID=381761 RepID=A0AAW1QH27_9CHLO